MEARSDGGPEDHAPVEDVPEVDRTVKDQVLDRHQTCVGLQIASIVAPETIVRLRLGISGQTSTYTILIRFSGLPASC